MADYDETGWTTTWLNPDDVAYQGAAPRSSGGGAKKGKPHRR
jgi:hypothetical protein